MKYSKINNVLFYQKMVEFTAIFNNAVEMAIEECVEMKLPVVFNKLGIIYYRMPDGSITTKSPFKKTASKKAKH